MPEDWINLLKTQVHEDTKKGNNDAAEQAAKVLEFFMNLSAISSNFNDVQLRLPCIIAKKYTLLAF